MKYALFDLRFSGEEDRESQAPGYFGKDGSDSGDPRDGRWPGDPTAWTLDAAGEAARDESVGIFAIGPSCKLFECSTGPLDGEDAGVKEMGGCNPKTERSFALDICFE